MISAYEAFSTLQTTQSSRFVVHHIYITRLHTAISRKNNGYIGKICHCYNVDNNDMFVKNQSACIKEIALSDRGLMQHLNGSG